MNRRYIIPLGLALLGGAGLAVLLLYRQDDRRTASVDTDSSSAVASPSPDSAAEPDRGGQRAVATSSVVGGMVRAWLPRTASHRWPGSGSLDLYAADGSQRRLVGRYAVEGGQFSIPLEDVPEAEEADAVWQIVLPSEPIVHCWGPADFLRARPLGSTIDIYVSTTPVIRIVDEATGDDLVNLDLQPLGKQEELDFVRYGVSLVGPHLASEAPSPESGESSPIAATDLEAASSWRVWKAGYGVDWLVPDEAPGDSPQTLRLSKGAGALLNVIIAGAAADPSDQFLIQFLDSETRGQRRQYAGRLDGAQVRASAGWMWQGLPTGQYDVVGTLIRESAKVGAASANVAVTEDSPAVDVVFRLQALATDLPGYLLIDEAQWGEHLEHMTIVPLSAEASSARLRVDEELLRMDGGFQWEPRPVSAEITAFKLAPLGLSIVSDIADHSGAVTIDVGAPALAIITVVDGEGAPYEGLKVHIGQVAVDATASALKFPDPTMWPESIERLAASGRLEVPVVPNGWLSLTAQPPGSAPRETVLNLGEGLDARWVLEKTYRLRVRVSRPLNVDDGWWAKIQIERPSGAREMVHGISWAAQIVGGVPAGKSSVPDLWIPEGVVAVVLPPVGDGPEVRLPLGEGASELVIP